MGGKEKRCLSPKGKEKTKKENGPKRSGGKRKENVVQTIGVVGHFVIALHFFFFFNSEEEREEACIHMYTLVLIYTIHARHERQKGGNAKPKRKSEK